MVAVLVNVDIDNRAVSPQHLSFSVDFLDIVVILTQATKEPFWFFCYSIAP